MGGEGAHEYMVPAIKGENVPESARTEFSYEDVQGGHGSAQIPLLQASCAAWYWHYRNGQECEKVLSAWRGYFDLDRWHTKEPYGVFRYRTWIFESYVSMHGLCVLRGESDLAEKFANYIRYEQFTAVLSCGWKKGPGLENQGSKVYPVAMGGSRSWVAGKNSDGQYNEQPYVWVTDWTMHSDDLSNMLQTGAKACWEVEPILRELERQVGGYRRWSMFSADDRQLCENLILQKTKLSDEMMGELHSLLDLIEQTGAKAQIGCYFIKTTKGVAWLAEESWSSGSTSFKYGAVWNEDGVPANEYPESWRDNIDQRWGWLYAGGHARRSDPGGYGELEILENGVRLSCYTKDGKCANGFTPGGNKHYQQWKGWVQDTRAWEVGPRTITLDGEVIWVVRIKKRGQGIEILKPESGGGPVDPPIDPPPIDPPPIDPPPDGECKPTPDNPPKVEGPGSDDLKYAYDQLVRAMSNWGNNKGDAQSRRSRDSIHVARRKMYG